MMRKGDSYVYVRFPKTGLGNMLLVWARAVVFAHLNQLPLVTSSWWGIRWGAWLRNENKKRLYRGYFRESGFWEKRSVGVKMLYLHKVFEPALEPLPLEEREGRVFIFEKVVVQNDLFSGLRDHRQLILYRLEKLLQPLLYRRWKACKAPEIGVHIRRGDFKKGNPITPTSFFIQGILFIRQQARKNLPVTLFTDADPEEIRDVLTLDNVQLAPKQPDILDMLQMSKSRVLILSRSSTFSYWAAFLSDAIVIKQVEDWQENIRNTAANNASFEGKVCFSQPSTLAVLKKNLAEVVW